VEVSGTRILVAGASGALGGALAGELADAGARVALAGRDPARLGALGEALGAPAVTLDLGAPEAAVGAAADALGGLDGLVVATGRVAFGPAAELPDDVARELFAVNALGPIGLVRAALPRLVESGGGAIVALSAVVADFPTAEMAAYSASKAALSAYLSALRREVRRAGVHVLDVRPGHLDTGFEGRALAGHPPRLPPAAGHREVARAVLTALRGDVRELRWDPKARALVPG